MSLFNSEKHMEDSIAKYIADRQVNPINGREVISMIRQPRLGELGIADLITLEVDHKGNDYIHVIELKNVPFHSDHIFQISRYLMAVKAGANFGQFFNYSLDGFKEMVAHDVTKAVFQMFPNCTVEGSLVVDDNRDSLPHDLTGVLELCNTSIYRVELINLAIEFTPIAEKGMCYSEAESIQSSLSGLAEPIKNPGDWRII